MPQAPPRLLPLLGLAGCMSVASAASHAATPAVDASPQTTDRAPAPGANALARTSDASITPIRIVVGAQNGYEAPARAKLLTEARAIAERVLNDPEYRQVMRTYPDIHGRSGFAQTTLFGGGRVTSNAQPMTALLRGNGADGQIHIWLSIEGSLSREERHTDQNRDETGVTYSKGSVIDSMTAAQLADHLVHEHMHRIGFQHEKRRSVERCDSVPYAYGRTVCQFAAHKYGLPGGCDLPTDWPPELPTKRGSPNGPRC
jgi:hypothetical protein